MKLNKKQQKIVDCSKSCVVLGAAGTGKTHTLVAKVKALLEGGVLPQDIAMTAFSTQSQLHIQSLLQKHIGDDAKAVQVASFRVFAQSALEADGEALSIPTDRQMRRFLRQSMREVDFAGTVDEAEHVIRKFKSAARKPHENERFYLLFQSYKARCAFDRFDVVRKHLLEMRSDKVKPVPVKHLLVDNLQDITQIQLLWLLDHIKAGVQVTAVGDDDLRAFALDGALGAQAFDDLADVEDVQRYDLKRNSRHPENLFVAAQAVLKPLKDRLEKDVQASSTKTAEFSTQSYSSLSDEMDALLKAVKASSKAKKTVGIITRTDWQALRVQRLLEKSGVAHTSFANHLWDMPGAIMMLDLLHVLLNRAEDQHLRNVLLGFGLSPSLVDALFSSGLHAVDWVKEGGDLPEDVELPAATLKDYATVQRLLVGYFKLIAERQASPQDIFKAAAYDLLEKMNNEDQSRALVAIDALLDIKGDLMKRLPEIRQPKQHDIASKIVVAPVRYVRNMEFDHVFMPRASSTDYPQAGRKALGVDVGHNRRLFYMAITRAKESLIISYTGKESSYVAEMKKAFVPAE